MKILFALRYLLLVILDLLLLVFQRTVQPDLLKQVELVDKKYNDQKQYGGLHISVVEFSEYLLECHNGL